MQVKNLTETEKHEILTTWAGEDNEAQVIDEILTVGSTWYAVTTQPDGELVAVFDVRKVPEQNPSYDKSMRLYFAPAYSLEDGTDFARIDKLLLTVSEVVAIALHRLISEASRTKDKRIKVFSNDPLIALIFREIAKYLTKEYPSQYDGSFYGKWIEIISKEVTHD